MSILQYKYKAHRLVNTLFYVIVFIIGFLLGFGAKEIDFSKLLSQVLMIDSASAYTIYENDNVIIDKEFIQNKFIEFFGEEIDFNIHKNYIASKEGNIITFVLLDDNVVNNLYINSKYSNDSRYMIGYNPIPDSIIYNINYYPNSNSYYHQKISTANGSDSLTTIYRVDTDDYYSRTNFDLSFATDEDNSLINQLDIHFNENLFKDNPDFKEVCVDSTKFFAISSNVFVNNSDTFADFLWFPYGLYGLYEARYNAEDNKIFYQEKESSTYHYYFTHKDVIDDKFDENSGLKYLLYNNIYYKYEDRYLYYGWTAYPFSVSYYDIHTSIPIYYFENPTTYSSIGNNIYGGGGTRLDVDNEIDIGRKYCFYIKNNYYIEYLKTDEFGDLYGDIITPNGNLHISSSNNKDNLLSGGLMSQVNNFIKQIKDTLNFIRENIYNFYLSMPLLLRMFLISIFIILIVKFVIGMVVK